MKVQYHALNRVKINFFCLLLSVMLGFTLSSCGSSSETAKEQEMPKTDSSLASLPDTSKNDSTLATTPKQDSTKSLAQMLPTQQDTNSLDFVRPTTDERINPVFAARLGMLSDGGYQMKPVINDSLGCSYPMASSWASSRKDFKNLSNYFINDKISVIVSVAYATFDSVNIWAQVQEAITFGKNQLPSSDWRFDTTAERKINTTQSYLGRYNFNNRQYNMAFFRYKDFQFNVVVEHPVGGLTEGETKAINYFIANFVCGDPSPTLNISRPALVSSVEPEPKKEVVPEKKKTVTKKPKRSTK
ncbi:MAG: hypothetical protein SFU91_02905 [Chloroherpetonaceae bacterium]|nr:hypothetical protein [Chloroherpetonaceae bacterium]